MYLTINIHSHVFLWPGNLIRLIHSFWKSHLVAVFLISQWQFFFKLSMVSWDNYYERYWLQVINGRSTVRNTFRNPYFITCSSLTGTKYFKYQIGSQKKILNSLRDIFNFDTVFVSTGLKYIWCYSTNFGS